MTEAAAPLPDDPEALRGEIKARVDWVFTLFGHPGALLGWLAIPEWRRLRRWVRGLEGLAAGLVRQLAERIAAEALQSDLSQGDLPQRGRAGADDLGRAPPDTDDEDSRLWTGVRFRPRFDPAADERPPPRSAAGGVAGLGAGPERPGHRYGQRYGQRSGRPLALRLEALIRVVEQAESRALRLARRRAQRLRTGRSRRGGRRSVRETRPPPRQPATGGAARPPRIRALGPPLRAPPPSRTANR